MSTDHSSVRGCTATRCVPRFEEACKRELEAPEIAVLARHLGEELVPWDNARSRGREGSEEHELREVPGLRLRAEALHEGERHGHRVAALGAGAAPARDAPPLRHPG